MEDDQQFCLRWNNHQSTLIQNFDTLLESGTLVDCTLAAEGKYLKAHKVVLSACSPYFEGLLSEHYDKHPVFILKDVKFKELKAMMDYMYRGEVNISQDQLAALLKAAESLQIKGLSESRTSGSSKTDFRQQKVVPQTTSQMDIPQSSSGLTIEKNKVPRQGMAQGSVGDLPEDSASPQIPKGLSSREGSQSPTSRKRKKFRRKSIGDDNSIENHEASNSSDMPQQMSVPALGIAPVADEKVHADPTDSIGRSALMTQLTKPADEMLQLPLEKPEPNDNLIEPKSEYLEDQEESVEDLTLDDDMNDLNEMEQDNNRAGPSHDPSQHPAGIGAWHVTGDRSNAGGVVGSVAGAPGTTDEVFLAAQEAAQAHRDSQGRMFGKGKVTSFTRETRVARPTILEETKLIVRRDATKGDTSACKMFEFKKSRRRKNFREGGGPARSEDPGELNEIVSLTEGESSACDEDATRERRRMFVKNPCKRSSRNRNEKERRLKIPRNSAKMEYCDQHELLSKRKISPRKESSTCDENDNDNDNNDNTRERDSFAQINSPSKGSLRRRISFVLARNGNGEEDEREGMKIQARRRSPGKGDGREKISFVRIENEALTSSSMITEARMERLADRDEMLCEQGESNGEIKGERWSASSSSEWMDAGDARRYAKSYRCEWCEETFHRATNLSSHVNRTCPRNPDTMRRRSNGKDFIDTLYVCDTCGRRFKHRKNLTFHARNECGKVSTCEFCKKDFKAAKVPYRHREACKRRKRVEEKENEIRGGAAREDTVRVEQK
ncbi:uncharacterized protein LOC122713273 isoform X4 [Apis laboriosa]|uniref:uncharacterized protein LOC122713273 isoform X4 n=1 Tax=Apis laboriosa TaxID=183418 RepID=UPI001CC7291C|nr:uncharacterized protein LOC122713273 isoform X4 [Apis laboriosa]